MSRVNLKFALASFRVLGYRVRVQCKLKTEYDTRNTRRNGHDTMFAVTLYVGKLQGKNFWYLASVSPSSFAEFEREIVAITGGISRHDSSGIWQDEDGEIRHEESYRYESVVACEDTAKRVLDYVARRGIDVVKQDSILAYYTPVNGVFIDA